VEVDVRSGRYMRQGMDLGMRSLTIGWLDSLNAFQQTQNRVWSELGPGHIQPHYISLKLAMLNPATIFSYAIFIVAMPAVHPSPPYPES